MLVAISGLRRGEAGMNSGHDLYRRACFHRKIKQTEDEAKTLPSEASKQTLTTSFPLSCAFCAFFPAIF